VYELVRRYPGPLSALEQIGDVLRDEDLDAAVIGQAYSARAFDLFETNHTQ
jgi:hypothetical protein